MRDVKTALILSPTAASFWRVAGLPVIQRTVLAALRSDFDRIVVIGGAYADQLRVVLNTDARTRSVCPPQPSESYLVRLLLIVSSCF